MNSELLLLVDVSRREKLHVTGADAARFLNGQATQDLRNLHATAGCYTAFVTAKGKMRADAMVAPWNNGFLLDLEPSMATPLAADLERFIIADDVVIENVSSSWKSFTLLGNQAAQALLDSKIIPDIPPTPCSISPLSQGLCIHTHRATVPSFDLWLPVTEYQPIIESLEKTVVARGGKWADEEALEVLRVEAGIPRFGREMDETLLPPEAGIEARAISYKKGCYIGQEVLSRIKTVGHANRCLARLALTIPAPGGTPLMFQDKEVGKLGTVIQSPIHGPMALAIIRREAAQSGTTLKFNGGEARVLEPSPSK